MLELLPSQAESRKFSSLLCKRLKLSSKHIYISRNLKGNFFQNNSHFLCMYRHRPWFGAINPKDKRVFSVKNNNSNQFDHALFRVSVSQNSQLGNCDIKREERMKLSIFFELNFTNGKDLNFVTFKKQVTTQAPDYLKYQKIQKEFKELDAQMGYFLQPAVYCSINFFICLANHARCTYYRHFDFLLFKCHQKSEVPVTF